MSLQKSTTDEECEELRQYFSPTYEEQIKNLRYDSFAHLLSFVQSLGKDENIEAKLSSWRQQPAEIVKKHGGANCVGLADYMLGTIDEQVRSKFKWVYSEKNDRPHLALAVSHGQDYILYDPGLHLPKPVIIPKGAMAKVDTGKKSFLFAQPGAPWPDYVNSKVSNPASEESEDVAFYCYGIDGRSRVDSVKRTFFLGVVTDEEVQQISNSAISGSGTLRYAFVDRSRVPLFAVTVDLQKDEATITSKLKVEKLNSIQNLLNHKEMESYTALKETILQILPHKDTICKIYRETFV